MTIGRFYVTITLAYLPLGYCLLWFLARRSSRRIPGASLPEVYQVASAASKNIELCLPNIGNAYRVSRAWKTTLAITAVLPKRPVVPWRRRMRLLGIVCNPQPAFPERFSLCGSDSRTIQNLREMVFAGINTGIHTGALANAFNERNCLIRPHRSARIVAVFLEIEYQQNARARPNCGVRLRPGTGDNTQEMIGLPNGITSVCVMICSPEQSRL